MANNIVNLFNVNGKKMDVAMSAKDAAKKVLTYSPLPLDQDDKAQIAVGCYEETNREDASEILKLYDLNSDVNCKIVALLNNDNIDTRDDLCEAIKTAFVSYFSDDIKNAINDVIADRYHQDADEHDLKKSIDPVTGEVHYAMY